MAKSSQASSTATVSQAVAATIPNCEVKVYLDAAKVLDVEFKPTRDLDRVLDLKNSNRKISMQFIDARPPQIHAEGWNVRVRKFEDDEQLELSFKRRYPLGSGSLADVLAVAARDGFHAQEDDYAAQLEWGFQKQTLSFTHKETFKAKGYSAMNLPTLDDVRSAAVKEMPGRLDRWKQEGWARGVLATGHLYGPVLGKRWTGKWQGPDLSLEVWLIKTESGQGYEPVVELSFMESKPTKATATRDKLLDFVRNQHWLLERDVLKTQMILDRY